MNINIGKKLTSRNLHDLIFQYWEKSKKSRIITFDFSETEWISNSEMTFLLAWINHLKLSEIIVSIQLPKSTDTKLSNERRSYFQTRLLRSWQLRGHIPDDIKIFDGGISIESTNYDSSNEYIELPILKYTSKDFDKLFDDLYTDYELNRFSHKTNELADLNHLDSDLLNLTILKELYSNAVMHSELSVGLFCQYSFSINKKIPNDKVNSYLLDERKEELSGSEKTFFVENNNYRNIDFVEIDFQDFGVGVAHSLESNYINEKKSLKELFGDEFEQHQNTNFDSKILHYSLLLFTSRYEIHKRFEVHDFIPRGLYILQELVAKNQGYLEIKSNKGALGISYLNGQRKINLASKSNDKVLFPGTSIKVVFPTKTSIKKITFTGRSRVEQFAVSNTINHISLIKHINQSKFELDHLNLEEEKKVTILSTFFNSINNELFSFQPNSIICIDFAGLYQKSNDVLVKFLFFIFHSPINSLYRIILINITTNAVNDVVSDTVYTNKSKGLHIYPIPVLYPDLRIDWIGITNDLILNKINELWKKGPSEDEHFDDNLEYLNSNILVVNEGKRGCKLRINLPMFEDFINSLNKIFKNFINEELLNSKINYSYLQNEHHNYNSIVRKKDGYVFLTSYGNYQDAYLSFNDKLYMSDYARFMVTHLIFSTNQSDKITSLKEIDKILSVTLSSQFLALSMRDVLKDLYGINVKVIALSNYYEFYKEKRFEEIQKNDKVLVINDIISTGKLTENIFDSLEKREAKPIVCFALTDLRNVDNKEKSIFKDLYPTIALSEYSIDRISEVPSDKKIEWINPILNTPTTLQKEKNHIQSLMSEDTFLKYVNEEDILIGNIVNNSYYLTYYLKTDNLLKREFSKRNNSLLNVLFNELNVQKNKNYSSELKMITQGLSVLKNKSSEETNEKITKIISKINEIDANDQFIDNEINLVCYPLMSNIQEIENEISVFKDLNNNNSFPEIYQIPRVLTERGWRFTFPPKFLNILSQGSPSRVLILDDGSCTGSTIIQMIDSVSFLTVKSIDVLSIFGRVEDYLKEFFHRIKSVRTKNQVVPINVFFGVHMNLPVLTERENSFHREIQEVRELQDKLHKEDENFSDFLSVLQKKLLISVETELIPWENISKVRLLKFRSNLGRFDSYRLYSEDIPDSGNFVFWNDDENSLLTLLIVLNLEPYLYKVFKRIVPPEIIDELFNFCRNLIKHSSCLDENQIVFLVKALFYLGPKKLFQNQILYDLIVSLEKHEVPNGYHYLNYVLLLVAYDIRNIEDVLTKRKFLLTCSQFLHNLKTNKHSLYHSQFRFFQKNIVKLTEGQIDKKQVNINYYRKLRTYFEFASINKENHPEKVLELQLNDLELKFIDFRDDPKNSYEEFALKLKWFEKKYFEDQDEYKYVKEILNNLSEYKPKNLNFSPNLLHEKIKDFENRLKSDINSLDSDNFSQLIEFYRKDILFETAPFNQFIQQSESPLQETWTEIESRFSITNPKYKSIKIQHEFKDKVEVNQYVIFLTFENIIKNKIQYAENAKWEIEYQIIDNEKCFLRFKQFSPFVKGRTGNGQAEIKKILEMNGSFYIREESDPNYVFRIEMPLKR
jgi:orotate phosphoribosyltransferase